MRIRDEGSFSPFLNVSETTERFIRRYFFRVSAALVLINFLGCVVIINKVLYTEIDWEAYMEEVAGVVKHGELDYKQLRGGTGPLVYPAGFVYIYAVLFYVTDDGSNIRLAQYIFAALHSFTLAILLAIYYRSHPNVHDKDLHRFPLFIVGFLFLSKRIVSLFVLRLFNDCVQTLLIYIAVLLFMYNQWSFGCLMYSLSVSVKMNALLYAPGLAVLLCQACGFGGFLRRVFGICLVLQVSLGLPFLIHAPASYLSRAFELTREFLYEWSVNGAFLSEQSFLDKKLAMSLLALHLCILLLFAHYRWTSGLDGGLVGLLVPEKMERRAIIRHLFKDERRKLHPLHVATVLFTSNFIGIVFARTLHYQFYVWYAHTIPYLIWGGPYPLIVKVMIIAAIEVAFNIYPPSAPSAVVLNICHMAVLLSLWMESKANRMSIFEKSRDVKVD